MGKLIFQFIIVMLFVFVLVLPGFCQSRVQLEGQALKLTWAGDGEGYKLESVLVKGRRMDLSIPDPMGEYTVLLSTDYPDVEPLLGKEDSVDIKKIENYEYIVENWKAALKPVAMNTAGKTFTFYPGTVREEEGVLIFARETADFVLEATWALDARFENDIHVDIRLIAKKAGFYSIASPTVYEVPEDDIQWAMLPGYFQGKAIEPNLLLSYGYGQGIPAKPVVVRERAASTLSPFVQDKAGITLAVIPHPGTGRDPWEENKMTHNDWKLGLSLMNRKAGLTPTLYYPVLGEVGSYLRAGELRNFKFRYILSRNDWFKVFKHAVYDIYDFRHFLDIKNTQESLTKRIYGMLDYLKNDSSSMWSQYSFEGLKIGAQSYLGGVSGSDKDAMKNSDYGAMWMLANATQDSILIHDRLPYARNFKLAQQQTAVGFFQGATIGQYYLWKSRRFTEEWGNYVEPIAITYYTMLDIGNILLFDPADKELRNRLRSGAEKLLQWQKADGSWEVAYDRETINPVFTDIKDLRPTFYGLLVAYRILGDQKYLDAAKEGAGWLLREAADRGYFLGACGDVRFVPDFATGQSAQAFMDLYDVTNDMAYLNAAIEIARIYTASVYTHPIPSNRLKMVQGKQQEDWQISQVGLSYEHGGLLGSANSQGPILLASHAGMFVRMFELTKDSIFIDMARAAAWGRDAFVDPSSHAASYYWRAMDKGPGAFPHHAWWQIGWIMDYLMSEASLRSGGLIKFPRGFITPKVGPHQTYGFEAGSLFGVRADLYLPNGAVNVDNQRIDFFCAKSEKEKQCYLVLINNSCDKQRSNIQLLDSLSIYSKVELMDDSGNVLRHVALKAGMVDVDIPALGLRVLKLGKG